MALYFFDSMVSGSLVQDEDGRELADFAKARHYALDALADIARHAIPDGNASISVYVRSNVGDIVYSAAVSVTEDTAHREV